MTYVVPTETTSPKFGRAFAAGCRGRIAHPSKGLQPGAFAGFCTPATWPVLAHAQAAGVDWYYGDHAYYRRGHYYRITKNAVQYVPSAAALAMTTGERYATCGPPIEADWRTGSAIVICPNSTIYMARDGINAHDWVVDVVAQLAAVTDRPLIVRWKSHVAKRPLYLDLHDAWAVVVYSSNAAVEALAAGVPVFVTAPWASTAQMGCADLTQIETPTYPSLEARRRFLWCLADHQWTLPEIASGLAWKALQGD